ncbi:Protein IMPACT [Trametes pubescens]|uniref:Protein IMPACT n=1 Tax=Trametes pubescens TaxID=154538 RepID=A0A1M2VSK9_TRAPU|nr:Protein IMPACT [Trametes pubescens]
MLLHALCRHRAVRSFCKANTLRRYSAATAEHTPNWPGLAASKQLTHLKSIFQGYAAPIPSSQLSAYGSGKAETSVMKADIAPDLLAHLRGIEPRTRRASHAMYAWRIRAHHAGMALMGSSNGGEAGAGERLERLLELSQCEDVIVVVFRWHGGVMLGSDRWKCISGVAKEALEEGGFLSRGGDSGKHIGSGQGPSASPRTKRRR